jgi:hypothetical protein
MDGVQSKVVHCIGAGIVRSTSFGFGPSRSRARERPGRAGFATSQLCGGSRPVCATARVPGKTATAG